MTSTPDSAPSHTEHLLPAGTSMDPVEISIVIPALNESTTITEFVRWCHEGIAGLGVTGQILIVDSSTDETPRLALAGGAEVLRVPKRGLGQAYIDAIPYIRGKYVLMGDADLTYDYRDLGRFHELFKQGYEFVMGSRFTGYIERGAMPALHQYFGTPVTTFILNRIYGTTFTDIHCGMRGMPLEALKKINLETSGWEYASEMIVKAVRLKLKIGEVPIQFYKDRDGRLSHHRRSGWLSPWKAGWTNLRAMFTFAPDILFVLPGLVLFLLGFGLSSILALGPIPVGLFSFNLNSLFFSIAIAVLGFSLATGGIVVKLYYNFEPGFTKRFYQFWTYDHLMRWVAGFLAGGIFLTGCLIFTWVSHGFRLSAINGPSIYGLELLMLGAQTFSFALMVEVLKRSRY